MRNLQEKKTKNKKRKNEKKFKTMEEKGADALEVAAQENAKREEKETGQSLSFFYCFSL